MNKQTENFFKNWTHQCSSTNKYYLKDGRRLHVWTGECWSIPLYNIEDQFMNGNLRLRRDIERIAELEQAVHSLTNKVHDLDCCENGSIEEGETGLELLDLSQQIEERLFINRKVDI